MQAQLLQNTEVEVSLINVLSEIEITQDILIELLRYNICSGALIWRKRDIKWFYHCKFPEMTCNHWNGRYANTIAGTIKNYGGQTDYIELHILRQEYKAHRAIWLYNYGHIPNVIDHRDQNGLNNRLDNLIDSSCADNQKNRPMQNNNTSGFNGVNWHKYRNKWQVAINVSGKKIYGGVFIDIEDAIKRRKQMNIEYGFSENHGRKNE